MQNCEREIRIRISIDPPDVLNIETLVLGFFSDERPPKGYCGLIDWRLNGMISKEIAKGTITGNLMEKVIIAHLRRIPASKILLWGLGKSHELTYDTLRNAGYNISQTIARMGGMDFAFDIPATASQNLKVSLMTEAMVTGGADFFSTCIEKSDLFSICVLGDKSCFDEIVLGLYKAKIDLKERIKLDISDIKKGDNEDNNYRSRRDRL